MKKEDFYFDLQRFAEDPVGQETTQSTENQGTEDVKKDPVMDGVKEEIKKDNNESQKENKNNSSDDTLDKIINEKLDLFKTNYENKIKELEKAKSSLDRKVSDQQKEINSYKKEKMSEEQLKELERVERVKGWHKLFVAQASVKYNLNKDDEDMNFDNFLYSNEEDSGKMEDEIFEKAKLLREYLDKVIKAGIERGVAERIAQGFKPKSSSEDSGVDDLEGLTKDDIGKKITEIMRTMPAGAEKDALIAKYMAEQQRRFSQ